MNACAFGKCDNSFFFRARCTLVLKTMSTSGSRPSVASRALPVCRTDGCRQSKVAVGSSAVPNEARSAQRETEIT